MSFPRILLVFLLVLGSSSLGFAAEDKDFIRFIDNFYEQASKKGISESTYKKAFDGITSPDSETIRRAQHQPEFKQELYQYFDSRVEASAIQQGLKQRKKWSSKLGELEEKYGVSRNILLAIWSMESSYGAALKNSNSSIIRSLATLAYLDKRRAKFGRSQLLAALQILQSGVAGTFDLRGSWAGAMGHTQFIPTSYLAYAQDGDGDGRKDVWHSVPDALASAANLLSKNGWRTGQTWGYEVNVPKSLNRFEGETRTLLQWEESGISRVRGREFSNKSRDSILHFPAGKTGPVFLMMRNFYVIKSYNNADKYALAVGHLADRIAGSGKFARSIPRPSKSSSKPRVIKSASKSRLSEAERRELQRRLIRAGLYKGKLDGNIGPRSRGAIIKAQKKLKLSSDGRASKELLKHLRKARLKSSTF